MTSLRGFLSHQGQYLLSNKRHAYLYALILAVLPYAAWLSLTVVALVTLRKGIFEGFLLLALSLAAYFLMSLSSSAALPALINAFLVFIPGYLAACTLYLTSSWRGVFGVLFFLFVVVVFALQTFLPDVIMAQYLYLQAALHEIYSDNAIVALFNNSSGLNRIMLANYLLGLQFIGLFFSVSVSLLLARYVQSNLYYPGGFMREVLNFRGNRLELVVLLVFLVLAKQHHLIAVTLLPVIMFYFVLAGLSLSLSVFGKQRPIRSMALIMVSLLLLPFVMLPVYTIFGSLDSLFNFRLYLPSDAGKTI
jgi:hypothetical protein